MSDKIKRVRRGQAETVEGNHIVGVKSPAFLTLVNRPANQRAFSVLRQDNEETKVTKTSAPRVSRSRRQEANPVQAVVFPTTYTDEQVSEHLRSYGMDTYKVTRAEDGTATALRSDLQSIANDLATIRLTEDGIVAKVARTDTGEAQTGKSQLAVTAIVFDEAKFTREDAEAWLSQNGVDFSADRIDNSSGNIVLQRMEVAEGEEERFMEISEGVTATIVRNDVMDIPEGYVAVISETAYSGWGWGQLDFAARLQDKVVGEALWEGLRILEDLLRDTLFYSPLPIELKKDLTVRALSQFGMYATSLIDTLPRQLLVSVSSTQRNDKAKEPKMSQVKAASPDAQENQALSRDDVLSIVREELPNAVAEALKAQRSDGGQEPTTTTDAPGADAPVAAPVQIGALTRDDLAAIVSEAVTPLVKRMEELEGTTVVRSDTPDPKVEPADDKSQKRGDVWAGSLPGIGRARS